MVVEVYSTLYFYGLTILSVTVSQWIKGPEINQLQRGLIVKSPETLETELGKKGGIRVSSVIVVVYRGETRSQPRFWENVNPVVNPPPHSP